MLGQALLDRQCPYCKERQYAENRIKYLKLFKICRDCDNKLVLHGAGIGLTEFIKREEEADKK